jgi:hypothetical protein
LFSYPLIASTPLIPAARATKHANMTLCPTGKMSTPRDKAKIRAGRQESRRTESKREARHRGGDIRRNTLSYINIDYRKQLNMSR